MSKLKLMSTFAAISAALMSDHHVINAYDNVIIKPKKRNKLSSYMTNINDDTTNNALEPNIIDKIEKAKIKRVRKNIKRAKNIHK